MGKFKSCISFAIAIIGMFIATNASAEWWEKLPPAGFCRSYYIIDKSKTCRSPYCQINPQVQVISAVDYVGNSHLGPTISCVTCDDSLDNEKSDCVQKNLYYLQMLGKAHDLKYAHQDGIPAAGALFPNPTAMFWISNANEALLISRAMDIAYSGKQLPADMIERMYLLNRMVNVSSDLLRIYLEKLTVTERNSLRSSFMSSNYALNVTSPKLFEVLFQNSLNDVKVTRAMLISMRNTYFNEFFNMSGALRLMHLYVTYSMEFLQQQRENLLKLVQLNSNYQGMLKSNQLQDDVLRMIRQAGLDQLTETSLLRSLKNQSDSHTQVVEIFNALIEMRSRQLQEDTKRMMDDFRDPQRGVKSIGVLDGFIGVYNLQGEVVEAALKKAASAVLHHQYGPEVLVLVDDLAAAVKSSLKQVEWILNSIEQLENGGNLADFRDALLFAVTDQAVAMGSEEVMQLAMETGDRIDRKDAVQKMVVLTLSEEYKSIFNSFVEYGADHKDVLKSIRKAALKAKPAVAPMPPAVFDPQTLDPTAETINRLWNQGAPKPSEPGNRRTTGR
ncbi:hypothetical protein [Bdellovibrio sp. HCB274]|uniref:hypothetical protein n=1 Tax=Bdellovibrio sp. HCB274 TaxID=3394361 RepID=UPI0039B602C0